MYRQVSHSNWQVSVKRTDGGSQGSSTQQGREWRPGAQRPLRAPGHSVPPATRQPGFKPDSAPFPINCPVRGRRVSVEGGPLSESRVWLAPGAHGSRGAGAHAGSDGAPPRRQAPPLAPSPAGRGRFTWGKPHPSAPSPWPPALTADFYCPGFYGRLGGQRERSTGCGHGGRGSFSCKEAPVGSQHGC